MADQQVEDLGLLASPAANDELIVNDVDDTTDDAGGSVKRATWSTLGGLETKVSSADADITAEVGVMNAVDISGYTAGRTWSLPTTAAVGDRCAVMITTGDDAYELAIRTTAASNDTINGVDHDSSDWSKLFITGETVVFRCVTANTAWIVENDGRIPCYGIASNTSPPNHTSVSSFVDYVVDTFGSDRGDIYDATNDYFSIRRDSLYSASLHVRFSGIQASDSCIAAFRINGSTYGMNRNRIPGDGSTPEPTVSEIMELSDGDYIQPTLWQDDSSSEVVSGIYMQITEIL